MKEQAFHVRQGGDLLRMCSAISGAIRAMLEHGNVKVTVAEAKRTRSLEQNAYLWGVVYPTILQSSAEMDGWTADDLHELFLGEHYGWQTITGLGRRRMKPINRSSKLTTLQFMDHIAFIQQYMAERGVYIPDPNEETRRVG